MSNAIRATAQIETRRLLASNHSIHSCSVSATSSCCTSSRARFETFAISTIHPVVEIRFASRKANDHGPSAVALFRLTALPARDQIFYLAAPPRQNQVFSGSLPAHAGSIRICRLAQRIEKPVECKNQ